MSAFKVGQRVRVTGCFTRCENKSVVGKEGVIKKLGPYPWADGRNYEYLVLIPNDDNRGRWFMGHQLAPLTDPKESEWADAMVKRVTKPLASKVTPWVTA